MTTAEHKVDLVEVHVIAESGWTPEKAEKVGALVVRAIEALVKTNAGHGIANVYVADIRGDDE